MSDREAVNTGEGEMKSGQRHRLRGTWASTREFLLTMIGAAVGFGNLWRFPYICARNGGGAFLIPYLIFYFTLGLPIYFLEVSVGQFSGRNSVHIWSVCPLFKGVGIAQILMASLAAVWYQNALGWTLFYFGMSFSPDLTWTSCSNWWNTANCVDGEYRQSEEAFNTSLPGTENATLRTMESLSNFSLFNTGVGEFWQYRTLVVSEGVHDTGVIQWHLALSLLGSWIFIFLSLVKGIKSIGKVVYLTVLLPYLLLAVLFIRTILLPGAVDGVVFYLSPDFGKLLEVQVWLEALLQMFYSISPGTGVVVNLSSYNKFNENCLRNAIIITAVDVITSVMAGLTIFTLLGFMANKAGVGISEVLSSGPGLAFVAYTEGLMQLPLPNMWAVFFFLMLFTAALDSQFAILQTVLTVVFDQYPNKLGTHRGPVTGVICAVCFLFGLMFTTQAGVYYMQLCDWYLSIFSMLLFAILETIVITWIYGIRQYNADVRLMLGRDIPGYIKVFLRFVTPALLCVMLFLVLWRFQPPTYGDYVYPQSAVIAGWIMAVLPVVPLPVMAVLTLSRSRGSLKKRLMISVKADGQWGPSRVHSMDKSSHEDFNLQAVTD